MSTSPTATTPYLAVDPAHRTTAYMSMSACLAPTLTDHTRMFSSQKKKKAAVARHSEFAATLSTLSENRHRAALRPSQL
ncbi:hypothetical protein ZWY2020_001397 [Hordeum vulgare]|nr:hypothetical protein ZWY2020_001397 [Hordeum vulgare]